ncbi:Gfo/Idh/MocA family oxidoreductase [Paenarthrobacter sp. Z7-10]|uniref:Gfo/Idh/MocA family oxidoreductase n=1 Tax=Paenarthrobacter sp. Z7-10 TaxID=2787635 RepID=UPI002E7A2ECB|nr:Gfo/Idh/MocA family oxidoreductase [Paenarthrobacter sp. Z7-10]MCZ2402940.1 Gfo/Idh/MocA family oxidoreductase [Paenarthrobacter sp. Z7-10]
MNGTEAPIRVITYGTFDLLHGGHVKLLQRAKDLGDYLIVGVTTDQYDETRGKLNVRDNVMTRIANVQATGLADEIIIEDYEGQKINDIQQHNADIFAIGSDWLGKFDYLNDFCKVVYLERTAGVSSTQLRAETLGITRLGVVGTGRVTNSFIPEALKVSGLEFESVYNPRASAAQIFAENNGVHQHFCDYPAFLDSVDAVYIASPHEFHFEQIKAALENGVHVLSEKPMTLNAMQTEFLYSLAHERQKVLLEAITTAYCPGFIRLVALARSGVIGTIKCVDATYTRRAESPARELMSPYGGSVTELASTPLLAISKILDATPERTSIDTYTAPEGGVDEFSRINLRFEHAISSITVGLGVRSEGHLSVTGTGGSIYLPAPWWNTTDIHVRFEDPRRDQNYHFPFAGDGLRYAIAEFVSMIQNKRLSTYKMRPKDSLFISRVIEEFRLQNV